MTTMIEWVCKTLVSSSREVLTALNKPCSPFGDHHHGKLLPFGHQQADFPPNWAGPVWIDHSNLIQPVPHGCYNSSCNVGAFGPKTSGLNMAVR